MRLGISPTWCSSLLVGSLLVACEGGFQSSGGSQESGDAGSSGESGSSTSGPDGSIASGAQNGGGGSGGSTSSGSGGAGATGGSEGGAGGTSTSGGGNGDGGRGGEASGGGDGGDGGTSASGGVDSGGGAGGAGGVGGTTSGGGGAGGNAAGAGGEGGAGGSGANECTHLVGSYETVRERSESEPGTCPEATAYKPEFPIQIFEEGEGYVVKLGYSAENGIDIVFVSCDEVDVDECRVTATCKATEDNPRVDRLVATATELGLAGTLSRDDSSANCTIVFDVEGPRK